MRILIAGLGSVGQRHARNLRTILGDDLDLMAYRVRRLDHIITSDLRRETGDVEAAYGLKVFTNLDEALAERPDAVFVTNPPAMHMCVALAAARAGCHLFIEKPLSHDLASVQELIDRVGSRNLVCLVGYQLRFHPGFRLAQARLERLAIGRILAARLEFCEHLPTARPYEDYRKTFMAGRDGGGIVLSQIHDLDYAYALFGAPRRVFALGGHLSELEMDAEDTASILMECTVDGEPVPVSLHQNWMQQPKRRLCDVIGTEGRIVLDFNAPAIEVFDGLGRPAESHTFEGFERNQMFVDEVRHFLACVRGGEKPVVGLREATQSLRMALAARESMRTGRAVGLA